MDILGYPQGSHLGSLCYTSGLWVRSLGSFDTYGYCFMLTTCTCISICSWFLGLGLSIPGSWTFPGTVVQLLRFSQSRKIPVLVLIFQYFHYQIAQNKTLCTIEQKIQNWFTLNKICDSESDDKNEGQGFQIVNEEDELNLTDNLHPLIRKVRTVVKFITDKKRYSA
jgi:hypothetical protein